MAATTLGSHLRGLLAGMARAPRRFPVTLGCALLWAAVTIADEHGVDPLGRPLRQEVQIILLLGFFAALSAKLFAEGRQWGWRRWLPFSLAALALPALAVFAGTHGRDPYESPAFLFMGPGLVLLMTVAPFLRRGATDYAIWEFNFRSWTSAAFGLLVAVLLAVGLSTAYGAVETLFGVELPGKLWGDTWIVCMSIVWPWQTLAGVPGGFEPREENYVPRWAGYVVSWLLVPIALVYLVMLYGFAARTAMQWELPRGTISWLVAGFAGFGLAVWMAGWPLGRSGNALVRMYHRFFHAALFLPVALLVVGIAERVGEYGITEPRYGLILLALWLGGIAVYGVVASPARLAVAPTAFAAILIAGSIGPWGATAVSIRSQLGELEALLTEAEIIADGTIRPQEGLADPDEAARISRIVDYLSRGGRRDALHAWLANAGVTAKGDEDNEALLALMGLDYVEAWREDGYFSYSVGEPETVDVGGFELVHNLTFGSDRTVEIGVDGGPRYSVGITAGTLTVAEIGRPESRVEFNLGALAETVRPLELRHNDPRSLEAMTLEASGNGLRARLHVENMNGRRNGFGRSDIAYGGGMLLIGRAE